MGLLFEIFKENQVFILLPAAHDFKLSGPKNLILFYFWHMISKRLTCLKYFDCYVIFCMKKNHCTTLFLPLALSFSLSLTLSLSLLFLTWIEQCFQDFLIVRKIFVSTFAENGSGTNEEIFFHVAVSKAHSCIDEKISLHFLSISGF